MAKPYLHFHGSKQTNSWCCGEHNTTDEVYNCISHKPNGEEGKMLLNGNNFHVSQILSFTSIEIYTAIAKGPHISLCFFLISQQFKAKVVAYRFSQFKMNNFIIWKKSFLHFYIHSSIIMNLIKIYNVISINRLLQNMR